MKHLRAWFWVVKEGHVDAPAWQAWAYSMIELMEQPPAWICDMATIDSRFEMRKNMIEHLKLWDAKDLHTPLTEVALSLNYLAFCRGEQTLAELLGSTSGTEARALVADLQSAGGDDTQKKIAEARTLDYFAKRCPEAACYFAMTHDPPEDVAREITAAVTAI